MYEAIPPSRRLKNKINVEDETLILEKNIERLIETRESAAGVVFPFLFYKINCKLCGKQIPFDSKSGQCPNCYI